MDALPEAFAPLAAYRQWVLWIAVPSATRPGKVDKFPVDPSTFAVGNAHDPAIWVGADEALARAAADSRIAGVGFVFTAADPFFFFDVDECLEPTGQWSGRALQLCQWFAGAAIEVSQSGRGLHIIGRGHAPAHSCKSPELSADLYTEGRFAALTGDRAMGSADADLAPMLQWVAQTYYPERVTVADPEWTSAPRADWSGPTDDDELIARALRSGGAAAAFGGSVTFRDLWECNTAILGKRWPDDHQGRSFDASSADAALAQHLAFWTGCDCERIQRLMGQSALVRDKWDARPDYLERTILQACSMQVDVYSREAAAAPVPPMPTADVTAVGTVDPMHSGEEPQLTAGLQLLTPEQQIDYFRGCIYVRKRHLIMTSDGSLLDQGRFKAVYGGYEFIVDNASRKTTKNAWGAFTESRAVRYPKAKDTIFRPDLPFGMFVDISGERMVNCYVEPRLDRASGDVSKFLAHVAKLLPDERDREIVLSYMAACVQHRGVKFQWCPLIQGVEGNGKTLLSRAVAEAVGLQYTHWPRADQVSNNFNAWIRDKLFIGLEDVYLPNGQLECIENLKPIITNDWQPVEPKGVDQENAYVVANFMLNSNHKGAIKKTRRDRRFAPFFTAQQDESDLAASGMDGNYFPDLYDWLKGRNAYAGQPRGYDLIADYLRSYPIADEFNPAGLCQRAPVTSSTEEAIAESLGTAEQEIIEAIEVGRPGFCGGWVSSSALEKLLRENRHARAIPPAKRRELMRTLGYDWHPALKNGRAAAPVLPDGNKPVLFIRSGHIHANLASAAEVGRRYSEAQGSAAANVFLDGAGNRG
jgi:hypothetical protein